METVDGPTADPSFDRYARLVSQAVGVPVALVSLVEQDRQVFPGACGLPPDVQRSRETPLSHSFCQHVVADRAPLVIADAREDDRLRDNLAIPDLGVIAYAGWPITDHTGEIVGSLCAIDTEPRNWTAGELGMLEDLAAACSTELAHRGLRAGEQVLAHRSSVLLSLSEGLADTRTLADVAAAVEEIAIELLGCRHAGLWLRQTDAGDGTGRGEVLTFVESALSTWESARLNADLPLDTSNPVGAAVALDGPQHFSSRADQNPRFPHLDISHQVGEARSFVPLTTADTTIGTLALLWDDERTLSDEDQRTIAALAAYTAQAGQRALLLEERLDALLTLQQSMLPRLPVAAGLELAARYRPADLRDQVGGDWYDATVLQDGGVALVVGDVVGHDLNAAATMGQLRHMLRTLTWAIDEPPSRTVSRLDLALDELTDGALATLVQVQIGSDRLPGGAHEVTWTNGGHPPPLIVLPDGRVRLLDDDHDAMLGVEAGLPRSDHHVEVPPGTLLLLYTDGLVERRGEDITVGLRRLAEAASRSADLAPAGFVDAVLHEMTGSQFEDDAVLLAVRFLD